MASKSADSWGNHYHQGLPGGKLNQGPSADAHHEAHVPDVILDKL